MERHCALGNRHMRSCLLRLRSHFARLGAMGVTEVSPHSTKHVIDFHAQQLEQLAKFRANFGEFRTMVADMVLEAARATFSESGFSYDDYPAELSAYGASATAASTLSGISGIQQQQLQQQQQLPPARKLTFIEQVELHFLNTSLRVPALLDNVAMEENKIKTCLWPQASHYGSSCLNSFLSLPKE